MTEDKEEKIQCIQSQELRMCSVRSILEYIQMAIDGNRAVFNLDKVTLALIDSDYDIRRILDKLGINLKQCSSLIFAETTKELPAFRMPRVGAYSEADHMKLFPGAEDLAWVAELPLRSQTRFYGSLNFGSVSREAFESKLDENFLQHMCSIAGLCLENALTQEKLKYAGLIDPLTETNNRRFFDQRIGEEVAKAKRSDEPLACLFMDIDHFKKINDECGHPAGDKALRGISSIIRAQLRTSDVFSRYGGEEFVALLPNTNLENAVLVAERIRSAVEMQSLEIADGRFINTTLSLGLSMSTPLHDQNNIAERLVENADHAVLAAKKAGRNRLIIASE